MIEQYIDLIAKLILPVVLLMLGIWAKKIATNHEKRVSLDERVIDKRIKTYESISNELNDVYVFLMQVGHWKDLTPQDIIQKKRYIDKVMYISRPYWSTHMFNTYLNFMNSSFDAWNGATEDAKIRTSLKQFELLPNWNPAWEGLFTKKELNMDEVNHSYLALIEGFSEQFGFVQEQ